MWFKKDSNKSAFSASGMEETLSLPEAPSLPKAPTENFASADSSIFPPPTVLVVDDEPLILKNLELLLSKKGCRVRTAMTGLEGLRNALATPPDAILLDIVMPEMNGYEVCRRIKEEPTLRHVPVLLITA